MQKAGKIIHFVIGLLFVSCGIYAAYIGFTGQPIPFVQPYIDKVFSQQREDTPAAPKPKDEKKQHIYAYSFGELAAISKRIAAAASDEEARAIAKDYHLLNEDGSLTNEGINLNLQDGRVMQAQLVGIRHDEKADGAGKAGLTFVTTDAMDLHAMNDTNDTAGGWEKSAMRAWVNKEQFELLPADLQKHIVAVKKSTNNSGDARDASQVTTTDDKLWLLSSAEVCGTLDWFSHEYGKKLAHLDQVINAEGTQYERYRTAGVSAYSDPHQTLIKSYQRQDVAWWYRSPFAFVYKNLKQRYFYNALPTGYPYAYSVPSEKHGVVVGFCI